MEIYNEQMELIENPNLEMGWLEDSFRTVHHPATEAVPEVWHHEVIAEYPNGGKDVRKVIDVPGVEAQDAWDEEIQIQIYIPYTQEELDAVEAKKNEPTQDDRIEAQVLYTAMMTDTLLEV